MRIAHIAPPWIVIPPKNYGGTENVIFNLVEEQVAQGHDVTLFAPGDAKTSARLVSFFSRSLIDSGVPWHAHLKAFYHFYKSVEYIKHHQYDVVHIHLSSSADMYLFPLMARSGLPLVATLHSRFPFDRVDSWTGDADRYFLEWLTAVPMVAISESARAEVPYPLNFVGVVHHGLPMKVFKPTVAQPENFLVWLGRFVPEKGAHSAIQVAKAVGLPLVLAGTIDCHVSQSVNYYENMIKSQIDGTQIKYIGPVNMREKIDLFSRARAFLNPIEWNEPFGMVMIEAMAVGCPVIAFARGAAPEIICHRRSGYLVKDVDEMIRYVAAIGELDRSVVREHIENNFSAHVMAEKYMHIYRQIRTTSLLTTALPKLTVRQPSADSRLLLTKPNATLMPAAAEMASDVYPSSLTSQVTIETEPESLQ